MVVVVERRRRREARMAQAQRARELARAVFRAGIMGLQRILTALDRQGEGIHQLFSKHVGHKIVDTYSKGPRNVTPTTSKR